jgi:hypothetical protein
MAIDASKLKRRLPAPPPADEGAAGIEAPLVQPKPAVPAPAPAVTAPVLAAVAPPVQTPAPSPEPAPLLVLDGRSLRATGRTMQMNVKVTAATKGEILRLAQERGQLVAEVIEDAIAALTLQR